MNEMLLISYVTVIKLSKAYMYIDLCKWGREANELGLSLCLKLLT